MSVMINRLQELQSICIARSPICTCMLWLRGPISCPPNKDVQFCARRLLLLSTQSSQDMDRRADKRATVVGPDACHSRQQSNRVFQSEDHWVLWSMVVSLWGHYRPEQPGLQSFGV